MHTETLTWLVRIRWASIFGQVIVFLIAAFGLGLSLEPLPFIGLLGTLALSNLSLYYLRLPWLKNRTTQGFILLFDVLLLTAVLHFYGGHTNPFSMVYLVHVILAALLLGQRWTWVIAIISSACYSFLFFSFKPIHELSHHHGGSGFNLHLQGMLVAFVLISLLITVFLQRMRAEIDWRDHELNRRRTNEEKLAALTTVSASVAHELGTPLSTMYLIVDELLEESRSEKNATNLIELKLELQRCQEALRRLQENSGEIRGEVASPFPLDTLLTEVQGRVSPAYQDLLQISSSNPKEELCLPREGLRHVLQSLVQNGLEASGFSRPVALAVEDCGALVRFTVSDRGRGMGEAELARVGEPFFTAKDSSRGMGLGLFITKLFTERLGGVFLIRSKLGEGTEVSLELPRQIKWVNS